MKPEYICGKLYHVAEGYPIVIDGDSDWTFPLASCYTVLRDDGTCPVCDTRKEA